ncbi:PDZ domain-containing protein [Nocardioides sp. TF02-7]|uniref:PDZ domain-containing protein n=1 Tax=Nocardioides sp. TF02-7 TaxID=2917724 RepID=UPI001F05E9D5|nr:PDZ domain-containing protein [Nocardioides sp. TF02-7]UMG94697.1 PDZ domain-containing protein [Nocardioides sp. TF02-7]
MARSPTVAAGWSASAPRSPASASVSRCRSTTPPAASSTPCGRTGGSGAPTSAWSAPPAPLTPAQAERFGQRRALRVVEVVEASPAALSGLRAGDLVLAVDGAPLGDAQSLQKRLFADAIGERMEVTVLRNGALVDAVAVPTELAD